MKTLVKILAAMLFTANAVAGSVYGSFATDPDLSVWRSEPSEMTGVQPGVGDTQSAYRGSGTDHALFRASPNSMSSEAMNSHRVNIYSGFNEPDLQPGF